MSQLSSFVKVDDGLCPLFQTSGRFNSWELWFSVIRKSPSIVLSQKCGIEGFTCHILSLNDLGITLPLYIGDHFSSLSVDFGLGVIGFKSY